MKVTWSNIDSFIRERGFFDDCQYYRKYFTDESDNEYRIDEEVEAYLVSIGVFMVETNITESFDSPGYECRVLSVAWVDDNGLHLETWLLEDY